MPSTENSIYYTLFTGLGVLLTLVFLFLFSVFKQQQRRIKEMKGQVIRDLALIEEERKRISADLHDDLGSMLAAVRMKLEKIQEIVPDNSLVDNILSNLDFSLLRIKQIAHNLVPGILVSRGLPAAILELVEEIRSVNKIKVLYKTDWIASDWLPEKSILIYRVIQEILANSLKHSEAKKISFFCATKNQWLILQITDDGNGFDARIRQPKGKHFGLENIQSRLQLLSAKFVLETAKGKGTRYLIEIPLTNMTTPL